MVEAKGKSASEHDKAKAELMSDGSQSEGDEGFQDCLDEEQFAKNFVREDDAEPALVVDGDTKEAKSEEEVRSVEEANGESSKKSEEEEAKEDDGDGEKKEEEEKPYVEQNVSRLVTSH